MVSTHGRLSASTIFRKERHGFKAGFALSRAARKGGIVAQAVIIHQIAERETVPEQNGLALAGVHGGLIRGIQRCKLFGVSGQIGRIGVLVLLIQILERVRDGLAQRFRVLQRQPDVLVVLIFSSCSSISSLISSPLISAG